MGYWVDGVVGGYWLSRGVPGQWVSGGPVGQGCVKVSGGYLAHGGRVVWPLVCPWGTRGLVGIANPGPSHELRLGFATSAIGSGVWSLSVRALVGVWEGLG